jgi:hypothetical protein
MKTLAIGLGTSIMSLGATVGAALACPAGYHQVLTCIITIQGVGCIKWAELCLPN